MGDKNHPRLLSSLKITQGYYLHWKSHNFVCKTNKTEVYNLVKLASSFYPIQKPKNKSADFVLLIY